MNLGIFSYVKLLKKIKSKKKSSNSTNTTTGLTATFSAPFSASTFTSTGTALEETITEVKIVCNDCDDLISKYYELRNAWSYDVFINDGRETKSICRDCYKLRKLKE